MSKLKIISVRPQWQQELAQSFTDPQQLARFLNLPQQWVAQHEAARRLFPLRVTRHFASLMEPGNTGDPLLLQVLPHANEFIEREGFITDPLAEQNTGKNGVLHKYKSRVLVILRGGCAINCRYCFRRHFPYADHHFGQAELAQLLTLIEQDPNINEVILSGGDPLMATDQHVAQLLTKLEQVPQLKRIRIHSRLPVVLPSRLTESLAQRLASSRLQAILVLHINHPNEISPQLTQALLFWAQAGITLLNQSVLLAGVNDDAKVLTELSEMLFSARVLPYYLHQLDRVAGASHFAVSDAVARALLQQLQANLPGFLVPRLVREVAGEPSKTPL